jgi:hypothetical protein
LSATGAAVCSATVATGATGYSATVAATGYSATVATEATVATVAAGATGYSLCRMAYTECKQWKQSRGSVLYSPILHS